MHFHIVTLFPESFESYLKSSIIGRAIRNKKIKVSFYNPRDFSDAKNTRVDKRPYGGGPGMVLQAEPVLRAVNKARGKKKKVKIIFFLANGTQFTNEHASKWTKKYNHIIFVCGHYEGVDARVKKALYADAVSIGPYILTGGELPSLIIIDSMTRQLNGALGSSESLEEKRIAVSEVYTRPAKINVNGKKYVVPKILQSGNHKKIEEWKNNLKKSV